MKATPSTKISIHFWGEREELDKIGTVFQRLKLELGINKIELYKKALLWITTNELIKAKFMERLSKEKAQEQQLVISK